MTRAEIVASLGSYRGQAADIELLESVIPHAVAEPAGDDLDAALFGLFERFPQEDGHGVYWSVLHALESRGAYESALVASLRRAPSPFTRSMLQRLKNAGRESVAGEAIGKLIEEFQSEVQ